MSDYSNIFKSRTLQKLATLSSPDERISMSELLANFYKNMPIIQKIESEYTDILQELAIECVYEAFPGLIQLKDSVIIDAKITSNPGSDIQESEEEDEIPLSAIKRRRLTNAITQGAAVRGTKVYKMLKSELDNVSPELIPSYDKIVDSVFAMYDLMLGALQDEDDLNLNSRANNSKKLGRVKVTYDSKIKKYVIKARGVCFVILIHEIVKGFYQILGMHNWDSSVSTLASRNKVSDLVDTPGNEFRDIKYGKHIYDALNNVITQYSTNPETREHFLVALYNIEETSDFVYYIENAINDKLTSDQINWTKDTIRDIESNMS